MTPWEIVSYGFAWGVAATFVITPFVGVGYLSGDLD